MTQRDADIPESRLHQKGYALLPWCVNGTLETDERLDVKAHLTTRSAIEKLLGQPRAVFASAPGRIGPASARHAST
jgi:hypothetical protein